MRCYATETQKTQRGACRTGKKKKKKEGCASFPFVDAIVSTTQLAHSKQQRSSVPTTAPTAHEGWIWVSRSSVRDPPLRGHCPHGIPATPRRTRTHHRIQSQPLYRPLPSSEPAPLPSPISPRQRHGDRFPSPQPRRLRAWRRAEARGAPRPGRGPPRFAPPPRRGSGPSKRGGDWLRRPYPAPHRRPAPPAARPTFP